ncbi:SusC/RagA family TonB-linked outer membrane protein [Arenibacter sp. TNZ]|uniref:TonB-dependent receptor n=1 Tax=Arenibacter TaxID=178469 RepID=UPI000CD3C01F|nr:MULTISPECIES: TonB-dependent receptor [Arenibacter]MCM4172781.1 SusC/RagA family TonB-linked outer membrane protein [Arenibacter sp. TNZ]
MKKLIIIGCSSMFTLKWDLKMKLTAFFLLVCMLQINATTYSQKTRISLEMNDVKLSEVLNRIETISEFKFFVDTKKINIKRVVDIKADKEKIFDILDKLFLGSNITYEVLKKQIILKEVDKKTTSVLSIAPSQSFIEIEKEQQPVTGTITDDKGVPLSGANILEKGTTNGTQADFDGNFSIVLNDPNAVLVVSYLGFATQQVDINGRTLVNIKLEEDAAGLDEVVVVGYGSVKKSDLTGSVSSVSSEDLVAFPVVDAAQALQGRAAGVTVQSTNGAPGSEYSIQIRGNTSINAGNDPLIVVDGFIGGTMPPSEDIKSIEILKDASSTAIYGARGANGVVIVSTKRGTEGKAQFSFSSSYSSQKEINTLDLLDADQFTDYIQELYPSFVPELTGTGTDWQDEIYGPGGVQNYQLSVAGGSDKLTYYLSGAIYDQQGVIKDSDYKRYSITSNLDLKVSESVNIGSSIFARRTNRNGVRTQEGGDASQTGVVSGAYKFSPTQGVKDENGDNSLSVVGYPIDNPYAMATEYQNEVERDLFQGNVYAEIGIAEGLKFKSTLGVKVSGSRTGQYYPTTLERGSSTGGEATLTNVKYTSLINENYLNYSKIFGDIHDVSLMAGYSYQKDRTELSTTIASGFISDSFSYWNLGAGTNTPSVDSELTKSAFEAFFGRVNYTLNDKYLFTFTGRYEGASVFAANNKYGFFPSAAFGWKISDEDFLSDSSTISLLKLRTSYGQVGNQAISPYQSLASFTDVFTTVQGSTVTALRPSTISNNDLSWETTTQTNIGVDFGILGNRFGFTADYYIMRTEDLLFNVPTPTYTGFETQLQNIGTVENRGFELALNATIFPSDFKWKTFANISFNKNEIIKLVENDTEGNDIYYSSAPLAGAGNTQILREGLSVGQFWGYVYDGVVQSADEVLVGGEDVGGEKFKDLNEDGELTDDDRSVMGNPHPDFTWGWNNDFSYKNLSLNIFIQGSEGGEMLNYSLMELGALNGRTNVTTEALNRWTPTNTDTDIPEARISRSFVTSDRWVDDASYVRLKNVSLSYNFTESLLSKINLTSARIYISGQNLLTLTEYKGVDPEVGYSSSSSNLGLDYGSYPNVKSYTLGLNIGF